MPRFTRLAAPLLLACAAAAARAQQPAADPNTLPLAGEWRFALDREDAGQKDQWFAKPLADKIKLPGILQSQGYGNDIGLDTPWVAALPRSDPDDPGAPFTLKRWWKLPEYAPYTKPGNIKVPYLSQPPKHYLGVAWYQRDIDIPQSWANKHVQLFLERPRWGSAVYIDQKPAGTGNSLVAPHEFDLGTLSPGKHTLSIRLDNRMSVIPGPPTPPGKLPIPAYRPDGHSVSDSLGQTWNGVVGKIELRAHSPIFIADAQVFPSVKDKSATIKVTLTNTTGKPGAGALRVGSASAPITWNEKSGEGSIRLTLGENARLWDEFNPNYQRLDLSLTGDGDAATTAADTQQVLIALREITHDGPKMLLNGKEINLRMTHSGGDFPLTGYPATDVPSWKKIIQTCKDHGLNGIRFHSWCPPEAAFQAADELGFYLQPECGMWNNFSNPGMAEMLEAETTRMQHAYGNHPSYLLLSPTNEPAGAWQRILTPWTARWYEKDPRRLYAENTGRVSLRSVGPTFAISPLRGPGGWFGRDYAQTAGRGGPPAPGRGPAASVPANPLASLAYPVLTHEVGQWCAYPDFDLIKKFTGYLQPGNYEIYRDSAAAHGVLDRNKEFAHASGKFQTLCYKEEIEANLRSGNLSGFQLLDLHDYLGQGGALVGILDPFWESKGYVTPEEFRRFCSETVPLARMRNSIYRATDEFAIDVEIAHYGNSPIPNAVPYYKIVDSAGRTVKAGDFPTRDIPIGKNIPLGKVTADLSQFASPFRYKLVVGLRNTKIENDWNFWLYPAPVDTAAPANVLITSNWKEAAAKLAEGGKVLYTPPTSELDDTCPPLNNVPVFWNRLMNPKLEAMLGLWCDAKHPALEQFPTDGWCDFQWTELVRGVRAINVERAPEDLRPIVSAIDDWARNYKLGVLFEARVGRGALLVSAIDIQSNLDRRLTARQLRKSLLSYIAGERFAPAVTMTPEQADKLWPANRPRAATRPTSTAPTFNPGDLIESPPTPTRER